VRVFIASADKTFRLALLLLLESEPGVVVIGMSDRSKGLLSMVGTSQPEVLLLDDGLGNHDTANLVGDLHHLECPPRIIVLSIDPQTEATALAAGADGFISKNFPSDALLPLLRSMRLPYSTEQTPASTPGR
jgi:DNA-binding NarL/FixJ family response regulator